MFKINPNDYDLILLNGEKGVGKDTAALHISKLIQWECYAMATPLKEITKIACGLSDSQLYDSVLKETPSDFYNYTPRKLMQNMYDLFNDKLREYIPEISDVFFAKHLERKMICENNSKKYIIFFYFFYFVKSKFT